MKILAIDDDESFRYVLLAQLTSTGADVSGVSCVADALTLSDLHSYDLIFMDLMMPMIDGFNGCSALRALKVTAPIIGFTAMADTVRQKCIEYGMDDFMLKMTCTPMQDLKAMLKKWGPIQ